MPTLYWLTRDEDLRTASHVPYRLLEEAPNLSAGEPDAGNMLIQGDNLEALKALLPFYAGRVKCIYIDPPYNTGKDLVYKDKFAGSAEEYLLESNQKDEDGNHLVDNLESNGRFHSNSTLSKSEFKPPVAGGINIKG